MAVGKITLKAGYLPRHRDSPLLPISGDELAAVLDEMSSTYSQYCEYLTVFIIDSDGSHLAQAGVGVRAGESFGCLYFVNSKGDYFSKGQRTGAGSEKYLDFGEERLFPPDSQVSLDTLKGALILLYSGGGERPDNVEWQEWQGWICDLDARDHAEQLDSTRTPDVSGADYSDPPF